MEAIARFGEWLSGVNAELAKILHVPSGYEHILVYVEIALALAIAATAAYATVKLLVFAKNAIVSTFQSFRALKSGWRGFWVFFVCSPLAGLLWWCSTTGAVPEPILWGLAASLGLLMCYGFGQLMVEG